MGPRKASLRPVLAYLPLYHLSVPLYLIFLPAGIPALLFHQVYCVSLRPSLGASVASRSLPWMSSSPYFIFAPMTLICDRLVHFPQPLGRAEALPICTLGPYTGLCGSQVQDVDGSELGPGKVEGWILGHRGRDF